ncbi:MAG: FAD-dependent oxidoreductase [Verrucomicrobiales bacterium]
MSERVRKYPILVLGGGFAGVYAARTLRKKLGHKGPRIALIADNNHMVFQPMLPEVVGGSLSPRHVVNPIRLLCKHVDIFKGDVSEIDLTQRQLVVQAGPFSPPYPFEFEHLVLAPGAEINLSRIPGMPEHAYMLQNVGDAMKLRAAIVSRMEEANVAHDQELRRRLLKFAVVGGGYSGVEAAGQIMDLLTSICRYYENIFQEDLQVSLIHGGTRLLPSLKDTLGSYTAKKLKQRGIQLYLQKRVKAVTAHKVLFQDGSGLDASLVVCTVGNAPHRLMLKLASDHDLECVGGRPVTDQFLQVNKLEKVWAAGDAAAVPHPDGGICPGTAQFAIRQASTLGKNLAAQLAGKAMKPFRFRGMGELAAIGHRNAVAHIFGLNFSGFIAWWMWRTIYLSKLPGLDRKLRVMIEWSLELFFPRDINLLTPQYTSPLTEVHLESGDPLFRSGEPAFSFYVVKHGRMEIRDDTGSLVKSVGPGEHFGERALLSDKIWRFNATAVEQTTLVSLSEKMFQRLVTACGSISDLLKSTADTYQSNEQIRVLSDRIPAALRSAAAGDMMQREVIAMQAGMPVFEALELLQRERHSAYPLLHDGVVLGMIRRSALYEWIKNHSYDSHTSVAEVPRVQVPIVQAEDGVEEVMERLIRHGATKALVLEHERLVGIITVADLLFAKTKPATPE